MDRGIIFDFNGTLFWDSALHEEAWKALSKEVRGTAFSDEECKLHMHGRTNPAILAYALGREPTEAEAKEAGRKKEEYYRSLCLQKEKLSLAPGAEELLEYLKEHNIPRAIATSSQQDNVDFYLKHFPLLDYFDLNHIIYDDGTLPSKPDPAIYLKAINVLQIPAEKCIVCEDAPSGILSAQRAKAGLVLGIDSGNMREYLEKNVEAKFIFSDFYSILSFFH